MRSLASRLSATYQIQSDELGEAELTLNDLELVGERENVFSLRESSFFSAARALSCADLYREYEVVAIATMKRTGASRDASTLVEPVTVRGTYRVSGGGEVIDQFELDVRSANSGITASIEGSEPGASVELRSVDVTTDVELGGVEIEVTWTAASDQ